MADGDRAAPRVHARVVVVDAEVVEQREHLNGERLVELEQADVVDRQPGLAQRLLGARDRADAHDLGLDAGEPEAGQLHLDREVELLGGVRAREQRHRRAVGQRRGVSGGDPSVRTERRLETGETLHGRLGTHALVLGGETPAGFAPDGDRDEVGLDLAGLVGGGDLLLAAHAEPVGALLGELGEAVVEALGGDAHVQGVGAHELLGEEAGVRVGVAAHGVAAHVLDTAGDADVVGAEADRAGDRGDARHGARAHPVDRVAGHAQRKAGEDGRGAPEGEALVTLLRRGRDGDIVDAVLREVRIPVQQPDHRLDDEVVGSGVPVLTFFAGAPEGGADPVDEYDIASLHEAILGSLRNETAGSVDLSYEAGGASSDGVWSASTNPRIR